METSIAVEERNGNTLGEETKKTTGKWNIKNEKINYSFDEPKSSIDSIFINTNFNNLSEPILAFSQKLDTAYIYGIPCIMIDKK